MSGALEICAANTLHYPVLILFLATGLGNACMPKWVSKSNDNQTQIIEATTPITLTCTYPLFNGVNISWKLPDHLAKKKIVSYVSKQYILFVKYGVSFPCLFILL